ncbi:hypothetical protein llap_2255 [Limosa lapponica baueri]|uniref:Uncharacterized protein n=1 Tax=Limosa lapponica baueri TaxID=1758121 RepID=A0A2I0UN20_LIMLA|nr:hypothetical protein llap_2255 [Limosa lapponica baueri]
MKPKKRNRHKEETPSLTAWEGFKEMRKVKGTEESNLKAYSSSPKAGYEETVYIVIKENYIKINALIHACGSLLRDAMPPPPREFFRTKFNPWIPGNSYL